jgi:hypothetical protein
MDKKLPLFIITLALPIAVIAVLVIHLLSGGTGYGIGLCLYGIAFFMAFSAVVQSLMNLRNHRDKATLASLLPVLLGFIIVLAPVVVIGWFMWQLSHIQG